MFVGNFCSIKDGASYSATFNRVVSGMAAFACFSPNSDRLHSKAIRSFGLALSASDVCDFDQTPLRAAP
jgi:hypothetical protein